jgi:hypothetical protein
MITKLNLSSTRIARLTLYSNLITFETNLYNLRVIIKGFVFYTRDKVKIHCRQCQIKVDHGFLFSSWLGSS